MDLATLFSLQGSLFAMMLTGAWLKKRGLIDENGKRCLTDLCINVIIPCNIFKSCLTDLDAGVFREFGLLLLAGVLIEGLSMLLNQWLFNRYSPQRKKVLQYCALVPNSGFLGNPIAEGIYGQPGVMYASVFLIPLRIIMWSVGPTYFVADGTVDKKKVLRNILTHPCLVAVWLGLARLLTQVSLPSVVTETVRYIGNCNSAMTMFIVGTILADVKLTTIVNRDTIFISFIRLVAIPAAALGIGVLLKLDSIPLGINVLMMGMPAGATTAIFAARYHSDAPFATRCVVMTTLASMLTIPLWYWVIGV